MPAPAAGNACNATAAALSRARLRASTPPKQWPMTIGRSSSRTSSDSAESVAEGVNAAIGDGSARSASTEPSSPGYAGASTL